MHFRGDEYILRNILMIALGVCLVLVSLIIANTSSDSLTIWITFSIFMVGFAFGIINVPFSMAFFFFLITLFIFNFTSIIMNWVEFKTLPTAWMGKVSIESAKLILFSLTTFMAFYMFLWVLYQRKDYFNKKVFYINTKVIRILYIITMVAYLIGVYFNLRAFTIVSNKGYLAYYTDYLSYRSQFFLLQRITSISPFLFFFTIYFLEGRSRNILFTFYWLDTITSLMTGVRNKFILNSMIFVLYLAYESRVHGKNSLKRFRKLFYLVLVIVLVVSPLIISGMKYIEIIRMQKSLTQLGIYDLVKNALYEQGLSGLMLIDYVVKNKDYLSEHKSFLLAPLREYFQGSIFAKALGSYKEYQLNTREYALDISYLGPLYSLLNARDYYLSGGGSGSSYIAEAYGDLEIFGVIAISILYSIIAFLIDRSSNLSPLQLAISIQVFREILIAPRGIALNFAKTFFSTNIFGNFLAFIFYNAL